MNCIGTGLSIIDKFYSNKTQNEEKTQNQKLTLIIFLQNVIMRFCHPVIASNTSRTVQG